MKAVFPISPLAAPRQTQRDKWAPRKCVVLYRRWKDKMRALAMACDFDMPECNYRVTFYLPIPKSWSKRKRTGYEGQPHQPRGGPDKDNLEKALLDALLPLSDSHVWDGRATKRWSSNPRIEIEYETEATP